MSLRHSEALDKIAPALVKAQAEFPSVEKGREAEVRMKAGGTYSYTYADLPDVLAAVVPVLNKNGIALLQPPSTSLDGAVIATTRLQHVSGQWLEDDFTMAAVDPRDARSMGSAVTYARRYGAAGMLGIAPADGEDDDGAAARGGDHEMPSDPAPAKPAPPAPPSQGYARYWCTNCGKQTVRDSKFGGYYCDVKAGGCNKKYTGPPPPPPPEAEREPAVADEDAPF